MDYTSSWDFTLANYSAVWAFMVQFGLLLLFLMFGNILRRTIPLMSYPVSTSGRHPYARCKYHRKAVRLHAGRQPAHAGHYISLSCNRL